MMMATWRGQAGWPPAFAGFGGGPPRLGSDLHDLGLLASSALSTIGDILSVSSCTAPSQIFWSSSPMPAALAFLTWSMPSRRTLRIATRALSAYWAATGVSSRRRSLCSVPGSAADQWCRSADGLMPRPYSRIAFSTLPISALSQTLIDDHARLGHVDGAHLVDRRHLNRKPRPWIGSTMLAEARPVRREANSWLSAARRPSCGAPDGVKCRFRYRRTCSVDGLLVILVLALVVRAMASWQSLCGDFRPCTPRICSVDPPRIPRKPPGSSSENTMMGRSLSRASAMAEASITPRFFCSASS